MCFQTNNQNGRIGRSNSNSTINSAINSSFDRGSEISGRKSFREGSITRIKNIFGSNKKIDDRGKNDDNSLDSLTETVASKHKKIKEMEDKVLKLISENEDLIKENDRIKRCARKMDQEIKALRQTRTC